MQLQELFESSQLTCDIQSLTNDSRNVTNSTLFIASAGFEIDIHAYIPDAYANGCRYFVVQQDKFDVLSAQFPDANFFGTDNIKKEASRIARHFYGYPDRLLTLIGITGTNGKTTTATLVDQALQSFGKKTAFFGTIEWRVADTIYPADNTTPDILKLIQLLDQAVKNNVTHVVMEVASHALSLGRVEDISFDVVGFTNLTQDHLDYHGDLENYFFAKRKLFTELFAKSTKYPKKAFVNADDSYGQRILKVLGETGLPADSLSLQGNGTWNVNNIIQTVDCTSFEINSQHHIVPVKSPLLGLFNVHNFLMAYAILNFLGFDEDSIINAVQNFSVQGRLQKIIPQNGATFLIDYAHTPDALEKAINAVNEILEKDNKSFVIFGAGGDRDPLKRPLMAQASIGADIIIVTSDNPRTEDPQQIIDDVLVGFSKEDLAKVHVEIDRQKAIALAYKLSNKGDVVLVAGKGHENYQIIGKEKFHFSDLEEVQKFC